MTERELRARQARRLFDAVIAVSGDLDLQGVLRRIVEAACDLTGARYGALGVVGPDRRLREFVHHGVSLAEVDAIGSLPEGRGILGLLILEPRVIRLSDLQEHPDAYGFPANHPEMHSFLGAPITIRGLVFGNLYLTEKEGGGDFTDDDEALIEGLAVSAAVAVENAQLFAEAQRRGERLEAFRQIGAALTRGAGATELLEVAVGLARSLMGADLGILTMPEGWPEHTPSAPLITALADGEDAEEFTGIRVPPDHSLAGGAMRSGNGLVVSDAATDPRTAPPVAGDPRWGPVLAVPVATAGEPFAALLLVNRRGGRPFTEGDLELIQSFAEQAGVVVGYRRAREELERLVVIEDRERIARDLHDTVIQQIFAQGMTLQSIHRTITDPTTSDRVAGVIDGLDGTIRDIRDAIFALQSSGQSRRGLRVDLLALANEMTPALGFPPRVRFDGPLDSVVPDDLAAELLVVAREALTNVAQHAKAQRVEVFVKADHQLRLLVADDGTGITDAARTDGGDGLADMARRAAARGGRFDISRGDSGGTELEWAAPLA
jgi:signal transduction histidine kinase